MNKFNSFVKGLFQEIGTFFTDVNYREAMKREFFYAIFYHWKALKLSIQAQFNLRYLIAAIVVLVIFVALEYGLQPYQVRIIDFISSQLNPILDSTDKTLEGAAIEDTNPGFNFFSIFSISFSIFLGYIKDYYRSFFSKEALGYIFSFEMYKYVVITLARPVLSNLVERVQDSFVHSGDHMYKRRTNLWENYKRGFALSLYSFGMQLLLTVLLFPFAPVSSFLISWYFTGVMLMDNYTRSKGLNALESHQEVWAHKWYAIGTGITFNILNFIPFIGPIIAPILSSVASAIGLHEIEKESKQQQEEEISAKDQAYFAAEKQVVEFGKDFNIGINIGDAFDFIKIKKIKLKSGIFMNLMIVLSIWVAIFYFLFNYTRTSKLLSVVFPLYKPETNNTSELATTLSFFDNVTHFFSVFFVLFLFGFVFYRFLVFLLQTQNIYSNSLTIQQANQDLLIYTSIDRIRFLINSFVAMAFEMFLMWATLYVFLISSGYSLLICLAVFLALDAVLIGTVLIVSRTCFQKLNFIQKAEVLWQHKGFVLATGIVYLLSSYIPFAALRYAPSLAVTTAEIGIQKIKLVQTIEYIKQKKQLQRKTNV